MKRIRAKLMLAFLGMAALAVALIWLVQAVFRITSYNVCYTKLLRIPHYITKIRNHAVTFIL